MAHDVFQSSEEELTSAVGKVTYLGPQEKPLPTVLFSSTGYSPKLERFAEIQFANKLYPNDDPGNIRRFVVTPAEFHRLLTAVQNVSRKRPDRRPGFLSFTVLREDGIGGEFHVDPADAPTFFQAARDALDPENEMGRFMLRMQEENVLPGG